MLSVLAQSESQRRCTCDGAAKRAAIIFIKDFFRGSTAVPALCSVVCITAAFHFTFCSNTCSIARLLMIAPPISFVGLQIKAIQI